MDDPRLFPSFAEETFLGLSGGGPPDLLDLLRLFFASSLPLVLLTMAGWIFFSGAGLANFPSVRRLQKTQNLFSTEVFKI